MVLVVSFSVNSTSVSMISGTRGHYKWYLWSLLLVFVVIISGTCGQY